MQIRGGLFGRPYIGCRSGIPMRLQIHHEPGLVIREAEAMSSYTAMVSKRASNPAETKKLMIELGKRAKKVE